MSPNITLLILNWNGKEDTLACLASLEEVDYDNIQIVVVDNGSSDSSVPAIKERFPAVRLIETGANLGFAGGNNAGLREILKTDTDYVFLLNNDTVVQKNALKAFAARADKKSILGAKLYRYDEPGTFDHLGGRWDNEKMQFDLVALGEKDDGSFDNVEDLDYVCGAALFAPVEAFREIGLLEERYFLMWEESDWCLRAKKKGFNIALCKEAKVHHKVSSSFVGGRPHTTYFWWRGRLLFLRRHCSESTWRPLLTRERRHLRKLRYLKEAQKVFGKKRERRAKALIYRAALAAMRDFSHEKFGSGPQWLFKQ